MTRRFAVCVLTLAFTAAPSFAPAEESALQIHGFGGWAAGYTSNDNLYPDEPITIASKDLAVDNYFFTLNLLARPTDKVVIHAQPTWQSSLRGRDVRLDVVYAEVTLAQGLLLRAGKIKNPLGIYTEIYKVGTLRPFYLLPNAYYRITPEGYSGLGANFTRSLGKWEVQLDALGGQMDFEPTDADVMVDFDMETMTPVYASIPLTARGEDVFGGGLLLRPPLEGLELGVSAYSMKLFGSVMGGPYESLSDERQKAYTFSLEYLNDKFSLRSELLLARGFEKDDCAYAELAYKLTQHWQIAGTWEYARFKEPPPVVKELSEHDAYGVALNYWVNPKLVWKANYYRVKGNRAARTADAVNLALAGTLEKETDVFIAGVHFAF